MSYDVLVWGARKVAAKDLVPIHDGWIAHDEGWTLRGSAWQLDVSHVLGVTPGLAPSAISARLPNVSVRVELTLQPFDVPRAARERLEEVERAIADILDGVIEDPQMLLTPF